MRKLFWPFYILVFSFLLGIMFWTRPDPVPAAPSVVMEILDPSTQSFAVLWQKEIARRFPNAVGDQWIVTATSFGRYLTAQDIARYEQAKYPGKTVVLLCCNPGHLDLGIKGVYFATDSVWAVPDRALGDNLDNGNRLLDDGFSPPMNRWNAEPGVAGNIFEFVED